MTSTEMEMEPTVAVSNTPDKSETIGKPDAIDVEFLLRDVEEKDLDRTTFNAKKQVWDRNEKFYGPPGSEKRKTLGRFINNRIKRMSWSRYVALLETKGIDMSETTETKLAEEIANLGGPTDVAMDDREPAATNDPVPVVTFADLNPRQPVQNATLIPSASSSDPIAMLTDQFAAATQISTKSPAQSTSPFRSPGGFSGSGFHSPAIEQRLSFDQPPATGHFKMPNNFVGNGFSTTPHIIHFNPKHPHHHGPLFVHEDSFEHTGQEYKATVVQKSGSVTEINDIFLEIATTLPQGLEAYRGRALEYKGPVANVFARAIQAFENGPATDILKKAPTVKALKKADVSFAHSRSMYFNHYLILFPLEQDPFDNRVFSPHDVRVKRETIPIALPDAMSGKQMYGYTSTWRVAHAGKSSVVEMRDDDKIDTSNFFGGM